LRVKAVRQLGFINNRGSIVYRSVAMHVSPAFVTYVLQAQPGEHEKDKDKKDDDARGPHPHIALTSFRALRAQQTEQAIA
jgi:hypothetical protein